jgi:outer membrane receptor protein involved in Fe transport
MNRLVFSTLILLLIGSVMAYAQTLPISKTSLQKRDASNTGTITITGVVVDEITGEGIEYPTVALFSDSLKVIKAVAGGIDGRFIIEHIAPGSYFLSASMIGYTNSKDPLTIAGIDKKRDVGKIKIKRGIALKEVVVQAVKPLVKNETDKLIYSVEADPLSASSNLVDILKKVPMLSVDGNDEIRLNGTTDYKLLVNGKSTGMMVKNFKDVMKSLPATAIKEIEVITNPPARYDAEGIGGVINIITSRRRSGGYNGNINANVSTKGDYGAGGYFSAQINKLALSVNLNSGIYNSVKTKNYYESENLGSDLYRYAYNNGHAMNKGENTMVGVEGSYDIDSLNMITISGWGFTGENRSVSNKRYISMDLNKKTTREYVNDLNNKNGYGMMSGSLSYQKNFKKPDKSLTFSYSIDHNPSSGDFNNVIDPVLDYLEYKQKSHNKANGTEHTIQADYYDPISKKHQFETGVKYILRQNYSDTDVHKWDESNKIWVRDNSKINDLDYNQHILGAYLGYVFKYKKLSLKGGARMEYTYNDGVSKSEQKEIEFDNRQFDLVPYVNLSYMFKGAHIVTLSYTQRLSRPGIWYLNPYINDSDPMNIRFGNPELNTVKRDVFTIGYRKSSSKWSLNTTANASFTTNNIESIVTIGANGVSSTTYENIGKNNSFSLNLNFSYYLGAKFNLYLNGSIIYSTYESKEINQSSSGFTPMGGVGCSVALWKNATATGNFYIFGGSASLQSKSTVICNTMVGLTQKIYKDKFSVSASVNQPFNHTITSKNDITGTNFSSHSEFISYPRSFRFSVNWRFGKYNVNVKKARKSSVDDKLGGGGATTGGDK